MDGGPSARFGALGPAPGRIVEPQRFSATVEGTREEVTAAAPRSFASRQVCRFREPLLGSGRPAYPGHWPEEPMSRGRETRWISSAPRGTGRGADPYRLQWFEFVAALWTRRGEWMRCRGDQVARSGRDRRRDPAVRDADRWTVCGPEPGQQTYRVSRALSRFSSLHRVNGGPWEAVASSGARIGIGSSHL